MKPLLLALCLVIGCGGCADEVATTDAADESPVVTQKAEQPEPTVTELSDDDRAALARKRSTIEKYLGNNEESLAKYAKPAGKLGLIRALLDANVFKPEQTYELQCLGIVFGDAVVQHHGLQWVMVEDENGRDPAVRVAGTSILIFPMTMISKRIEDGEEVDVFQLFNGLSAQIAELKAEGV